MKTNNTGVSVVVIQATQSAEVARKGSFIRLGVRNHSAGSRRSSARGRGAPISSSSNSGCLGLIR